MTRVALAILALAVRLLPVQARRRYAAEFDAELHELGARRRPRYALSILAGSLRLRWQLLVTLSGGHASAWCWAGLHRDRRFHPNPEDPTVIALQCRHCGRIRDPRQYLRRRNAEDIAWANVYLRGN